MQVSPSGMASASQADFGGSDSRHLLQQYKTGRLNPTCFHLIEYKLLSVSAALLFLCIMKSLAYNFRCAPDFSKGGSNAFFMALF